MLLIHSMPKVGLKDSQELFRNLPVRSSLEIQSQEWSRHSKSFARNPFLIQCFNFFIIKFQFSDRTWRYFQIFQNIFEIQVLSKIVCKYCDANLTDLTWRYDLTEKLSVKFKLRCLVVLHSTYVLLQSEIFRKKGESVLWT